jgi:hypothetical protein
MCKTACKASYTFAHYSPDIQGHVEDQCFVLTFLKAMMRIMLVTNTAIPPMRENNAKTIRALRTEKNQKDTKSSKKSTFCKKLVYE